VQVDPIKPTLKAPGSKRLKIKRDKLVSRFAFNFNMRRYTEALERTARHFQNALNDLIETGLAGNTGGGRACQI